MNKLLERFEITFVQEIKTNSCVEIIYKDDDVDYMLSYLPYVDPYSPTRKRNAYFSLSNFELIFFTGDLLNKIKISDPQKYGLFDKDSEQHKKACENNN